MLIVVFDELLMDVEFEISSIGVLIFPVEFEVLFVESLLELEFVEVLNLIDEKLTTCCFLHHIQLFGEKSHSPHCFHFLC